MVTTVTPNTQTIETNVTQIGRVILCPYTEEVGVEQPFSTGTMLVNPYAAYNPLSIVQLVPAVDNWIDESTITINKQNVSSRTVINNSKVGTTTSEILSTNVSSKILENSMIEYMRQTTIKISGSNFTPNEDNIKCVFNDKQVPLTPLSGTQAGTQSGTIKVKSNGTFEARITIPPWFLAVLLILSFREQRVTALLFIRQRVGK